MNEQQGTTAVTEDTPVTNDRTAGRIVVSSLACLYLSFGCFVLGAVFIPWSGVSEFFWALSPLFGYFCLPLLVIAIIVRLSGPARPTPPNDL